MEQAYETTYHELERTYWLLVGTRELFVQYCEAEKLPADARILEVGSSTGVLLEGLRERGWKNLTAAETSSEALRALKAKGIKAKRIDTRSKRLPFKSRSFDLIIASNVLEHIHDDDAALSEWSRLLKTDGRLVIVVPAFMSLWSSHDRMNKHYRRYHRKELERKASASFLVEKCAYWNASVFLPLLALRRLKKEDSSKSELFALPKPVNALLLGIIRTETWLLRKGMRFPWGVSLYLEARLPGGRR